MDFKKVIWTDYSKIDEFKRAGYTYRKVYTDENYVVWQILKFHPKLANNYYEVWKAVWGKQNDGTPYLKAPSNEEFGRYGWTICGNQGQCRNQIQERFGISIL